MNTTKGLVTLAFVALSTQAVAQSDNPFQFKEAAPVEPVSNIPVVTQSTDLSDEQKAQVLEMIKQSISAIEMKVENADSVSIDGKQYVLLKPGDIYHGVTSGMYFIYSKKKNDFAYFDSQKFSGVMTTEEYQELANKSKADAIAAMSTGSMDARTASPSIPVIVDNAEGNVPEARVEMIKNSGPSQKAVLKPIDVE
ncbi:MAG: hypothetical protein GY774_13455 [Planctomycetes bacterium]|nr:hypothetical protein [Planctomycetota bacterium]